MLLQEEANEFITIFESTKYFYNLTDMDVGDLIETIGDIGTNLPSDNPNDSKRKRVFKTIVKIVGVLMLLTIVLILILYMIAEMQ